MPETLSEEALYQAYFRLSSVEAPAAPPDCEHIYNELTPYRKFNLTLTSCGWSTKKNIPMATSTPSSVSIIALAGKARLLHAPGAPRR